MAEATAMGYKDFGGLPIGSPIKSPYIAGKHLESRSFDQIVGKQHTWLGILNLLNNFEKMHTPLLSMTEVEKNVIYVDGQNASFIYGIPYKLGCPYLVEVLCEGSKIGIGQQLFHIVLSENIYTYGDIITAHRRHGKQLLIVSQRDSGMAEAEITPYGNGFRYLVRLASGDLDDYIDEGLLQPQQEYEKIDQINGGEFSDDATGYTGMLGAGSNSRTGLQLHNYTVGTSDLALRYWVTADASLRKVNVSNINIPQLQFLGNNSSAMADVLNFYTKDQVKGYKDGKPVLSDVTMWLPSFILELGKELAALKEKKLLWSTGYYKVSNGREVVTGGLGYYQQIKQKGNHFYYSDFRQAWNIIMNFSSILYSAKYNVKPQDRRLKMKLGRGIYEKLQPYLKQYFEQDNKFTISGDHEALKGMLRQDKNGDLIYEPKMFKSVFYPNFGWIEFEVDDSLTMIDGDQKYQKYYEKYPESAFMIFIEDITSGLYTNAIPDNVKIDGGKMKQDLGNVVMIKRDGVPDSMEHKKGSGYISPALLSAVGASEREGVASDEKGLGITMRTHGEVWVQDPSRVLMIEFDPYGEKEHRDRFKPKLSVF
jgi:hypothetical protein